jgi:p-cumate 2,3-dioxygenase beta subunit
MSTTLTRNDIEEFLFREAALLDDWKLAEWLELFTDDARYEVPSTSLDRNASVADSLFFVADDRFRLGERVARLGKKGAHVEYPHSRTRHLVSNVLIESREGTELEVSAAFAVFRYKDGNADTYVGQYRYRLRVELGKIRIASKRCVLDMDVLRPHGRVSILL